MKRLLSWSFVLLLVVGAACAQTNKGTQPEPRPNRASSAQSLATTDEDRQQLSSDLQRLKVLLNQMRTNLAFVQTSPTPLKHQFELEADAWQVIVEQMERRLQKMERNEASKPHN
jgi:predicted  nucleic acid-binding Zn-ribbon protein